MKVYENATMRAWHVTLFEGGDPEFDCDFIVAHTIVPNWADGQPLHLFDVIEDEEATHDAAFGHMGTSDVDVMIRDLVTGLLFKRDEDEWQATWESIEYEPLA